MAKLTSASTPPAAGDVTDATGLRQDLLELRATHRAARAELELMRRELTEAEQIVARIPDLELAMLDADADRRDASSRVEELGGALARTGAERDAAQAALVVAEREQARLHADLHALVTSRGWRLLRPARVLAAWARRGRTWASGGERAAR